MLFALAFDKMFFGHTPGTMSILGSSLILGPAIFIAIQKDPNRSKQNDDQTGAIDEESHAGLLDVESGEDHERLPVQEIQMRTLR